MRGPRSGDCCSACKNRQSRTYDARRLPADIAEFPLTEHRTEVGFAVHADTLRPFIPELDRLPLAHHIAGLSTYTPDGRFLVGRAGPLEGFLVAGGCCGKGMAASGGIGEAIASLVLGEMPEVDLQTSARSASARSIPTKRHSARAAPQPAPASCGPVDPSARLPICQGRSGEPHAAPQKAKQGRP